MRSICLSLSYKGGYASDLRLKLRPRCLMAEMCKNKLPLLSTVDVPKYLAVLLKVKMV